MLKNPVVFTHEKETMLIPLYGKAQEISKKKPIIVDHKAAEILEQIQYDFSTLNIPKKTNQMMCLRARLIDNFTKDFLGNNNECTAVHLGCGLDSRYYRIQNSNVNWYDVDFQEVIDLKKIFFEESAKYHMVSSSVTDSEWIEQIAADKQNIVIAEGLFMYLDELEIRHLLRNLQSRLESHTLIFDAFSIFAAKQAGKHPSIKKTGAAIRWGIDNPKALEEWGMNIRFIQEIYFTDNDVIQQFDSINGIPYKIANLFSFIKKAQRMLVYEVN